MTQPHSTATNPTPDPHARLLVLYNQLQKDLDTLKKQGQVLASKLQSAVDKEKITRIQNNLQ